MDFDLFFSSPRWKILEILAKEPSSPIEISHKLNTTVSYVSQQLKLLDAAGIIIKRKTGSAEKGKPRTIYSISKEILLLTSLMNNLPSKKIIPLTEYHKIILKIWLIENSEIHYHIEKFYWRVESHIKDIEGIFIDITSSLKKPKIIVVSETTNFKKIKQKIDAFMKEESEFIDCLIISKLEFKKFSAENLHSIHDPNFLLSEKMEKELKGGINEK